MKAPARRGRLTQTLAVGLTLLTLGLFALAPFLDSMVGNAPTAEDDGSLGILWLLAWLGFPLVGGFLALRRPRHPIGWILVAITLGISVAIVSESVAIRHATEGAVPLGGLSTWVTHFSAAPPFVLVPFLILLFPTGRIESILWRQVAIAAAVVGVIEVILLALVPESQPQGVLLVNPLGVPALAGALDVLIPTLGFTLGIFGIAVVANAALRFRRSSGAERQQFRWFARAAAIFPIGMGLAMVLPPLMSDRALDALVSTTFFVSFNGMAVAIGIAVTRYRLYEIDRVISRTVTYAAVTAILVGVYAVGVLGIGALLPGEPSDLLVAVSTLAVAALFRPLRSRIQAILDQRFNRARYNASRTVAAFAHRLRDPVDLPRLADELRTVTITTFQPRQASVWLPGEQG